MNSGNTKKVVIILLLHNPDDCFFQYNLAFSLRNSGMLCDVYSACDDHMEEPDKHTFSFDGANWSLEERANYMKKLLADKHYDLAICDTPLAVVMAHPYAPKVVYYVTEWYPSKKNLRPIKRWKRPFKFLILAFASVWAGLCADAFLFGEYHKAIPFRLLFFWKKYLYLPYYPRLDIFSPFSAITDTEPFTILYAGPLTAEKGWERIKKLCAALTQSCPQQKWQLLVLSDAREELKSMENFTVTFSPYVSVRRFCQIITYSNICIDVRDKDIENTRCLPVKLFYYLAAGRPVIYSNLKAIRRVVPEIINDSLVEPDEIERVAQTIVRLATNRDTYKKLCLRNRKLAEDKYNWNVLTDSFMHFIKTLVL